MSYVSLSMNSAWIPKFLQHLPPLLQLSDHLWMAKRASLLSISGCLYAPWWRGMIPTLVCLNHRDPELKSETRPTVSSCPSYIKSLKAEVGHWSIIYHSCLIIKFNTLIRHLAPRATLNFFLKSQCLASTTFYGSELCRFTTLWLKEFSSPQPLSSNYNP